MHARILAAAVLLAVVGTVGTASAQVGTAFTYQGQLKDNGQPVNGSADVRFTLFGQQSGGSPIGSAVTASNVTVANGLFTTPVDFGVAPYTATDPNLWMQIEVRSPAGVGGFSLLGARQKLAPTPFSLATRGLTVGANGDVQLRTEFGATRILGLAQGNALSTNLLVQAGGTLVSNGTAQNGGQLTLRAGNANLSAASAPPIGTSGGNDVVIQGGENTATFLYGDRFSGNIRFIAGDSGTGTGNQPERMRILGDNGFVGIGTTAPSRTLDVNGGGIFADTLSVTNKVQLSPANNGSNDGALVAFKANGTSPVWFTTGIAVTGGFPTGGYQSGLVNNAVTSVVGGMFINYSTDQTTLFATIKNFVEPNPRDASTDIYYASLEGPEAAMYIRGTGTLQNGRAIISLPTHFSDLASSQGITVLVTPLSADSMGLAVVGKSTTSFEVRELMRGTGTYSFDWEVKAVRAQHLDYKVIRSWNDRRIENPNITDAQAWQLRVEEVNRSNARAQALEAAARAGTSR
jgi:hypothetical protein